MATKFGAQRLKPPLEKTRSLRDRSTRLRAQSKSLRKLVWEQHYETLLLMSPKEQTDFRGGGSFEDSRGVSGVPVLPPNRSAPERGKGITEGDFVCGASGAGTEFIRTELLAGITRAKIAENTSDENKKQRNRLEARKAYDAVLRFLPQTFLSQQEKEQIDSKLTELKVALRTLGEEV